MGYNIISGVSQEYYHTIPSDIDLIQASPTRESIFEMLSQIPYSKFPEFIADILVMVEKHTLIDVTDGQGDEKQDILSETPEGKRCLTQCKHSINYKDHHNGDELDLMFGACMRKDCQEAIYVTNSDLTPQGKKYVNDKEYQRGWKGDPSVFPKIEYWNGNSIWDRIKNENALINKWFSGLGQLHGLRSFKFDLTIQKLPYAKDEHDSLIDTLMESIKKKKWATEIQPDFAYTTTLKNLCTLNIKRWFQFSGQLDINFMLPNDDVGFIHNPLYALTLEAIVSNNQKVFSAARIREAIIKFIGKELLSGTENGVWWHLTSSQIKSNVYLHDIKEPRELLLETAYTFVKYKDHEVSGELEYCMLDPKKYELLSDPDDATSWNQTGTQIKVQQLFEQKFNPVEDYNHQVRQFYKAKEWLQYEFKAVEGLDGLLMMRARQLLPMDWIALDKDGGDFIWGYPKTTPGDTVSLIDKKIAALGLRVLKVKQDVVEKMIDSVKIDIKPRFFVHGDFKNISFPIALEQRVFYLSKHIDLDHELDVNVLGKLLVYKFNYESKFGFVSTAGKEQVMLKEYELKGLLFNLMTFRGKRMIDIGIGNGQQLWLNIRYNDNRADDSTTLADTYCKEFRRTEREILKILGES